MVGANANDPVIQPVAPYEPHPSEIKHQSDGAEHDDISVSTDAAKSPTISADASIQQRLPALRRYPGLTEREVQILHGLVQGHSNRMIARTCDITKGAVRDSREVDPAEDRGKKPHAGGSLGNGERLCRLNLLGCAAAAQLIEQSMPASASVGGPFKLGFPCNPTFPRPGPDGRLPLMCPCRGRRRCKRIERQKIGGCVNDDVVEQGASRATAPHRFGRGKLCRRRVPGRGP